MSDDKSDQAHEQEIPDRALLLESFRRAMYAHLRSLLAAIRRDDDPIIAVGFYAMTESGIVRVASCGARCQPHMHVGAAEMLKIYDADIGRDHQPSVFFDPSRGWKGDQAKGDRIVCGADDETEADREVRENGALLVTELIGIVKHFYGSHLSEETAGRLNECVGSLMVDLKMLSPDEFYKEQDGKDA